MCKMKTLALFGVLALATSTAAIAQEVLKVAEPNWASGRAMAGLIKVVIEDKFGGKAELVSGTNAVTFKAMD